MVTKGCKILLYLNISHTNLTDAALRAVAKYALYPFNKISFFRVFFCRSDFELFFCTLCAVLFDGSYGFVFVVLWLLTVWFFCDAVQWNRKIVGCPTLLWRFVCYSSCCCYPSSFKILKLEANKTSKDIKTNITLWQNAVKNIDDGNWKAE